MKPWYIIIGILMLALVMCPPVMATENVTPKAVVLDLSINNDVVHVIGSRVVNNYPPDNRASREIVVRMLDAKGSLLAEQGIDDPRVVYLEEGATLRDNVNFSVIVAFRSNLATIRLINGTTGAEMVSADVSGSVNGYCREHGSDPDCAAAGAGPLLPVALIIMVIVVLLAGAGWYLLRKKKVPEQKQAGP